MLRYRENESFSLDENFSFRIAAISVIGDRKEQQDSFGFALNDRDGMIVICDGMGGHKGGQLAGKTAVNEILTQYGETPIMGERPDLQIETMKQVDRRISQLKNDVGEPLNAGSTAVSVYIHEKRLNWCSVGDSRAYLLRRGELVQLTQDHNYHTVLKERRSAGLIGEEEYRQENEKGEALISFLGIGNLELIDYSCAPLELASEDKIVLMSDGLYKIVPDVEIARILENFNDVGDAVRALEMKAQKNTKSTPGLRDNMTVVLVKIK